MVALSFKVFREKIESGEKEQTIRLIRVNPIKIGQILQIYWKQRDPKQSEKLFEAKCTYVENIAISENKVILKERFLNAEETEKLALEDGFDSSKEFFDFFKKTYGQTFFGVLIKFKKISLPKELFSHSKPMTAEEHLEEASKMFHELSPDQLMAINYKLAKMADLVDEILSTEAL